MCEAECRLGAEDDSPVADLRGLDRHRARVLGADPAAAAAEKTAKMTCREKALECIYLETGEPGTKSATLAVVLGSFFAIS
jgi:hypothetical protein